MPSFLHEPGFEDFPLRLSQGLWQHSSRWEPTDFEFFSRKRQSVNAKVFERPKLYQNKRRESPRLEAYWIYKSDEQGPPLGWAELQSFPGKRFAKGFLFFALADLTDEIAREALIALTSLIFTVSRNDHLHLIPAQADQRLLGALAEFTGTEGIFFCLPSQPWHPRAGTLQPWPNLAVDRSSWRSCAALQESLRAMKHIEMRLERLERLDGGKGKGQRRKKRPFLVRLFKPRVDDPLF